MLFMIMNQEETRCQAAVVPHGAKEGQKGFREPSTPFLSSGWITSTPSPWVIPRPVVKHP